MKPCMVDEQTLFGVASYPHVYKENKSQHCVKNAIEILEKRWTMKLEFEGTCSPQLRYSTIGLTKKKAISPLLMPSIPEDGWKTFLDETSSLCMYNRVQR
jgi:hypothetical protein